MKKLKEAEEKEKKQENERTKLPQLEAVVAIFWRSDFGGITKTRKLYPLLPVEAEINITKSIFHPPCLSIFI
jgi:hypothetical protein